MCRWLAFTGAPVLVEGALYTAAHSLIDQSLHARMGAETTNGDGFGIGWYDEEPRPGVFHGIEPAWNDSNLREISAHVRSRLFFAHVRAAIGSAVQQTNCHPFRHGQWLWMHNGVVAGFREIKRDLVLAIDASIYPDLEGTTDSETLFYLALSFGLVDDPRQAVARAIGLAEALGIARGVKHPFQGTIAATDGERIWAFRYSSEGRSRTLFLSSEVETIKQLYPRRPILEQLSDDAAMVVSEPLDDLPGIWHEVPEASYALVGPGAHEVRPFAVQRPSA